MWTLRPLAVVSLGLLAPGVAAGQAIERHLPPAPEAAPQPVPAPATPAASTDDRPIAGPLTAIVVLGLDDKPLGAEIAATPGIDAGRAAPADRDALARALKPFLGRPISRRLIGEIQAAAVRAYRRLGRPLVSVTTPPQEVGGGRLQLRVAVYRLADKTAKIGMGAAARPAPAGVLAGIRAPAGEAIDADALSQDLDWLNRYAFRSVAAAFAPGAAPGDTDLLLTVTPSRPVRAYAGYADSGSPLTGRDRYFAGLLVGLPTPAPTLLSYQLTGGPDAFDRLQDLTGAQHPQYLSHSARLTSFIAPRQDIELTVDAIQTNGVQQDFLTRSRILEAVLGYRFALSNLWRALPGDLVVGVEAKQESRTSYFGGAAVVAARAEVYQAYAGWSGVWTDFTGRTGLDLTAHLSPGRTDPQNSSATLQAFTSGRVTGARYGYLAFSLTHTADLPWGLSLSNEVIGQYAARALPDTEQGALGGSSLVRGYTVDDGAYDRTVVVRNTLALPWPARAALGPLGFDRPFVFVDGGWGEDQGRAAVRIGSAGLGQGLKLGPLGLSASLCFPLANGPGARASRAFGDLRATVGF